MDVKKLQKLKENFPFNWKNTIAEKADVSVTTVWNVFNGKSENRKVIEAALWLAEKELETADKLEKLTATSNPEQK